MTNTMDAADTVQARWARFRFSIIGPLLSSPPGSGELQSRLAELAIKEWCHPINSEPVSFSLSTLERWFYKAKKNRDPVAVLRSKRRCDADKSRTMNVSITTLFDGLFTTIIEGAILTLKKARRMCRAALINRIT